MILSKRQDHTLNTRRNQTNLINPSFRTNFFRNSLFCVGPDIWNSLPSDIKENINRYSINISKCKINKYLFSLLEQEMYDE